MIFIERFPSIVYYCRFICVDVKLAFLIFTFSSITLLSDFFPEFCSEFPSELKNPEIRNANFPLEVITSDYVTCGQSIRDERSREVTVNVS